MTDTALIPDIQSAFSTSVIDAIIEALHQAYLTACEQHDPPSGSDMATFGYCLYRFACFRLTAMAQLLEGVENQTKGQLFRLGIGDFEVGCHRVGSSEYDDIQESFPHNDNSAWTLGFPEIPLFPEMERVRPGIIIAHMGNPDDGLCAVYLAVPGEVSQGRIRSWRYTQLIWSRQVTVAPSVQSEPERPAPVEVNEAPIKRKTRLPDEAESIPEVPAAAEISEAPIKRKTRRNHGQTSEGGGTA